MLQFKGLKPANAGEREIRLTTLCEVWPYGDRDRQTVRGLVGINLGQERAKDVLLVFLVDMSSSTRNRTYPGRQLRGVRGEVLTIQEALQKVLPQLPTWLGASKGSYVAVVGYGPGPERDPAKRLCELTPGAVSVSDLRNHIRAMGEYPGMSGSWAEFGYSRALKIIQEPRFANFQPVVVVLTDGDLDEREKPGDVMAILYQFPEGVQGSMVVLGTDPHLDQWRAMYSHMVHDAEAMPVLIPVGTEQELRQGLKRECERWTHVRGSDLKIELTLSGDSELRADLMAIYLAEPEVAVVDPEPLDDGSLRVEVLIPLTGDPVLSIELALNPPWAAAGSNIDTVVFTEVRATWKAPDGSEREVTAKDLTVTFGPKGSGLDKEMLRYIEVVKGGALQLQAMAELPKGDAGNSVLLLEQSVKAFENAGDREGAAAVRAVKNSVLNGERVMAADAGRSQMAADVRHKPGEVVPMPGGIKDL